MKKTIAAALLLTTAFMAAPKRSEAALVMTPIAIATGGTGYVVAAAVAGGLSLASGAVARMMVARCSGENCIRAFIPLGLALIFTVLDTPEQVHSQLVAQLIQAYPALQDDRPFAADLATALMSKIEQAEVTAAGGKPAKIRFTEAELLELFASTDLAENGKLGKLEADLK